jgi:transposase
LQVDIGTGSANRAQAGTTEVSRYRDEPAWYAAWLRDKGGCCEAELIAAWIRELVEENATLQVIAEALLAVHAVLLREFKEFEKRLRITARRNVEAQLLMSAPGVGAIVALTVTSAIDDPARFKSSKRAGAHFGMTPKNIGPDKPILLAGTMDQVVSGLSTAPLSV